ncbi:MAG: hypothetical protein SX243_25010 [Acidobacteriota bacterium]|nr:hypothetical protein [Acidobacteriota bacterium]
MPNFVSKSGVTDINVGGDPSRSGTPLLEMRNLVPGNIVRITSNFAAKAEEAGLANGFNYEIGAVNAKEVTALSPTDSVFQGSEGWQSCTVSAYFRIDAVTDSPTEDIDFEVLFGKGELSGKGSVLNFLLFGEVVGSTME